MSEYEQVKNYRPLMASEGGICIERHEVFEPAPEPQMVSDCCKAEIFSEMDRSIAWDTKEGYTNEVFCSKCGKSCEVVDKEPLQKLQPSNFLYKEPATPIENPRLLTDEEMIDAYANAAGYSHSMNGLKSVCKAQDAKTFDAARQSLPTVEEIKEVVYDNSLCKYNCEFWDKAGAYCYAEPKDHCALATAIHNLWEVSND